MTSGFSQRSLDGGIDQLVVDGQATALWLCGKRVVGPAPAEVAARIGRNDDAVTVVCLCERHEIEDYYPHYVAWLTEHQGGRARWWPIPDLGAPTSSDARAWATEVNSLRSEGQHVVIHCGAGMGRAPTLAVAALILDGRLMDDVLAAVPVCRPLAGPESGEQMDLLREIASGVI
ncbi:MAG: hypothetical protein AAF467_11110 [Actinomycetota bacterium]